MPHSFAFTVNGLFIFCKHFVCLASTCSMCLCWFAHCLQALAYACGSACGPPCALIGVAAQPWLLAALASACLYVWCNTRDRPRTAKILVAIGRGATAGCALHTVHWLWFHALPFPLAHPPPLPLPTPCTHAAFPATCPPLPSPGLPITLICQVVLSQPAFFKPPHSRYTQRAGLLPARRVANLHLVHPHTFYELHSNDVICRSWQNFPRSCSAAATHRWWAVQQLRDPGGGGSSRQPLINR